ncbi:MAG: TerC family protein [Flavobacteriales bacterium]
MSELFTLDALISLVTLATLEVVLGIDNVIFVSIILGRIPEKQRLMARRIWMVGGIIIRSALLLSLGWLLKNGENELFKVSGYSFNLHDVIMFAGGLFLMYKSVKEVHEKLEGGEEHSGPATASKAFGALVLQILLVDMVFSFDSIITAIGLAKHVEIMIIAVIIAMMVMFFFAQGISTFIEKHPALKMLALSFLIMVGFMLFFEGLHPVHGKEIPKGYVYFAMAFSFGVELLNMRVRSKHVVKLNK